MIHARAVDTDPAAEEVQFALLRQTSASYRVRLALSLSETVIGLARRAIRRALDEHSKTEVGLRFVELHYGRDLADALRVHLAGRRG